MLDKLKGMVSSLGFWAFVVGAIVYILGQYDIIPVAIANGILGLIGVDFGYVAIKKIGSK